MTDFNDAKAIAERMKKATGELHALVDSMALAQQVIEFSSDQRKNTLARYMAPLLKTHSVAAAEALARASDEYKSEVEKLERQFGHAHKVKAKWHATNCTLDATRSLFSMCRETVREFQG